MHFALPTRNYRSSPFLASTVPRPYLSRRRPALALLLLAAVLLVLTFSRSPSDGERPAGEPDTVMVLLLDHEGYSDEYIERVISNRREYANAHGYALFTRKISDYPIGEVPVGWSRIPALRHAMAKYGHSTNFWLLDQHAIIMNPSLSLESHVLSPERLRSLMRRNVPIVQPDSVIKTYSHIPPERVQFILTQDSDGLHAGSMIIRKGPWADYLLDAWFDPLFRLYGFQKAEQHALEHIVQWHPTVLTRLALLPQRTINSYPPAPGVDQEAAYEDGDFVVHFKDCDQDIDRDCEKEFMAYWRKAQA